jgi:hypothetical protein
MKNLAILIFSLITYNTLLGQYEWTASSGNLNIILSPSASTAANISDMGMYNAAGAETENYGTMTFFGQRLGGVGLVRNIGSSAIIEID